MELGNTSNVKWFAGIGEYVIDWGPGYRIYLAKDGESLIVLFGGGTKRRATRYRSSEGLARRIQGSKAGSTSWRQCQEAKEVMTMALTRDFKKTVVARVERDPAFAKTLLDEAATLFLSGEPVTARLILRELVNATLGFERLAKATATPSKSLHRMLSSKGNPSMDNLAAIFDAIRKCLKVSLKAQTVNLQKVA
jgi:DNA-binding phage protein